MSKKKVHVHVDISRLIMLIQAKPMLYDKTLPEYSDREVTGNAWLSVARELGETESSDVTVKLVKEKWKNLRDTYMKKRRDFMQSKKSGTSASDARLPTWPWYTSLEFLEPYIPDAPTQTNMPPSSQSQSGDTDSDADDDDSQVMDDVDSARNTSTLENSFEQNRPGSTQSSKSGSSGVKASYPLQKRQRYSSQTVAMASLLDTLKTNADKRSEERKTLAEKINKETHPLQQFMLSYMPMLERFSDNTAMEFRIRFTTMVKELRADDKRQKDEEQAIRDLEAQNRARQGVSYSDPYSGQTQNIHREAANWHPAEHARVESFSAMMQDADQGRYTEWQ